MTLRLYVDSSVILRVLFEEAERLREWDTYTSGVTSALTHVECIRSIDRLRLRRGPPDSEADRLRSQAIDILLRQSIVPLNDDVLRLACGPFPTPLGSLDALHLASALLLHGTDPTLGFATHDRELGIAARAIGLTVYGA